MHLISAVEPGHFATLLKQRHPSVEVIGLDPDPKALARARRKAERSGVSVRFNQGFADTLEYPAAAFDAIFSSFMFHHLEGDVREKSLREVCQVLKPRAAFYLLDFDVSQSAAGRGPFSLIHSSERLRDNSESRILSLMDGARVFRSEEDRSATPSLRIWLCCVLSSVCT